MFVRVTVRNNKNGPPARYLQVVHNYRPPGGGASRSKVLLNLGRVEDVDGGDLARLAKSILKHVGPEDLARADLGELLSDAEDDEHGVDIPTNGKESVRIGVASSRQIGVQLLLWTLWVSCGLDALFQRIAAETKVKKNLSKLVFLIVLNRTLDPKSKYALPGWASDVVWVDNGQKLTESDFYRALDLVAEHDEEIQADLHAALTKMLGDENDTVLYDVTSSYFEMDEDDEAIAEREAEWVAWEDAGEEGPPPEVRRPQVTNEPPLRMRGYSRDHRGDLPQITIALALNASMMPIRSWVFPGNTADCSTVRQIQQDLAATGMRKLVFVGDRGMTSEKNLTFLESENVDFILGEKLRDGDTAVECLLGVQGPWEWLDEDRSAFVMPHPDHKHRMLVAIRHHGRAKHDARVRGKVLQDLNSRLTALARSTSVHPPDACEIERTAGLRRYVQRQDDGRLALDEAAVAREARLDGLTVLNTSLTWESVRIADGYRQLLGVEDGWRTMKTHESLRPIYHRRAHRIGAHVTLCAVGLALIHAAERLTCMTWHEITGALATLHRVALETPAGLTATVTRMTPEQERILTAIGAPAPAAWVRGGWSV